MSSSITLKVSGSLLDASGIETLARALDQRPAGTRVILVHGGGPQLDEALAKLDEPVRHHQGLRVTSRAQAGVVQATLDRVGSTLTQALREHGVPAEHVHSLRHRLLATPKRLEDGVDLGRVGTPVDFQADAWPPEPRVPVLTPVGTDGTGPLNVNADEAAAAIAEAQDSRALVFATKTLGVLDTGGRPIETVTTAEARRLIEAEVVAGGMQPKLEAATSALEAGIEEVRIGPLSEDILDPPLAGPQTGTRIAPEEAVP